MSLNHQFWLLENFQGDYDKYLHASSDVNIHDELLRYISDTLSWIPTFNLGGSQNWQGLAFYGVTTIDKKSADILLNIINAWIILFSYSPPTLKLTGFWTEKLDDEGNVEGEGYYETLEFDRDDVIKNLKVLADYAKKTSTNDNYTILHIGI